MMCTEYVRALYSRSVAWYRYDVTLLPPSSCRAFKTHYMTHLFLGLLNLVRYGHDQSSEVPSKRAGLDLLPSSARPRTSFLSAVSSYQISGLCLHL